MCVKSFAFVYYLCFGLRSATELFLILIVHFLSSSCRQVVWGVGAGGLVQAKKQSGGPQGKHPDGGRDSAAHTTFPRGIKHTLKDIKALSNSLLRKPIMAMVQLFIFLMLLSWVGLIISSARENKLCYLEMTNNYFCLSESSRAASVKFKRTWQSS